MPYVSCESHCSHADALVVVEVFPLCRVDAYERALSAAVAAEGVANAPNSTADNAGGVAIDNQLLPLCCIAALPCSVACSLLKEVGHAA